MSLNSFFTNLDFFQIATILGAIGLPIFYWIESIAWILKSLSPANSIAMGVAKSNVLLYVGRFFYFCSYISIAYLIDHGIETYYLQQIFLGAMVFSGIMQFLLLNNNALNKTVLFFSYFFRFQYNPINFPSKIYFDKKVFIYSCVIGIGLVISFLAPFLLANQFLDYRLTLNSLGQVLNIFATLFLLLALDPILYKEMDNGRLLNVLKPYILGRLMAFLVIIISILFYLFC